MKLVINPDQKLWAEILQRPTIDANNLLPKVQAILDLVKERGDDAVKECTLSFDQVSLSCIQLSAEQLSEYANALDSNVKKAIDTLTNRHFSIAPNTTKVCLIKNC